MNSGFYWLLNQQYVSTDKTRLPEVSFMDQMIEQFSCSRNDQYTIEGAMGMPLPPFVACFSTDLLHGNMLGVADEDGHVKLIDTSKTKRFSIIKEWSAHSNAIFDLAWVEKESKMVTASGDQTARLWDIEKCVTIGNFRGHTCSLKSIAVQPRSSRIFLTGARDGNIMLWDTRCNMRNGYHAPINTISKAHERAQLDTGKSTHKKKKGRRPSCQADSKQSVTAAVFMDDCRIISSGACDGALKYWDIRKNYSNLKGEALPYHVINFSGKGPRKHGFSSLILNSTCSRLFSVCTNNIIYEFSTTNLSSQPIATYQGHRASSFYVKAALSPDDRYLLCGSGDNSAYIWRTDQPNANPWVLNGHSGEVTSVAWSPNDGDKLVTCSDDNTFKIWRLFQDNSDPLVSCGTVKRKSTTEDSKTADKRSVTLQEDVLELDIPEKKAKCFCNTLNMAPNRKVRVRWNIGIVHHAKDTICKIHLQSNRPKTWNSASPFTVITPKSTNNPTPNRPLRDKLNVSPSNSPAERRLSDVKSTSPTPKSSRLFMETWLKSPHTPGKVSPVFNYLNQSDGKLQIPDTDDDGDNPREQTPHIEIGKQVSDEITEKSISNQNDDNVTCKNSKYENSEKNNFNEDVLPSLVTIIASVRVSPAIQSKKRSPARSKRYTNTRESLDIKSMLLSMKRKCMSPVEEENPNGKRSKAEKENTCEDIVANSDEIPESETLIFDGRRTGIQCTINDKENISNDTNALQPNETNKNETINPRASKLVLKDIPMQKEVKDILDIAGDSSSFYS